MLKRALFICFIVMAIVPTVFAYTGPRPGTEEWRQMYYHKEPLPVQQPGIIESIFSVLQTPADEQNPVVPVVTNIKREIVEMDKTTHIITVKTIELPPMVSLDILNKHEWKTENSGFIKGDR